MTHQATEKRKYEDSHGFLTFTAQLKDAGPDLWLKLGECKSKCEHLAKYPLRPDIAEEIHRMYMAKGVLATTAIEGNTLSEEEVRRILDGTLKLPPSREYLEQEVSNIIDECNRILGEIKKSRAIPLDTERIKNINFTVLNKTKFEPHVIPGEIRTYSVGVGLYRGAPYEDCEYLLDRLTQWLDDETQFGKPTDDRVMVFAILKACFVSP